MTEMKSSRRPELKREKSAPEFRVNNRQPHNRNSRERDEDRDRDRNNRRSDGFYGRASDSFGYVGRGQGHSRGRGGRGGRGGYDDNFRGGGRNNRGGFDDRSRGGFEDRGRVDRKPRDNYQGDRERLIED